MKKLLLLFFLGIAVQPGCGGDDIYSSDNHSQNDWRKLPEPEQLFGNWHVEAFGVDSGCFSNSHLRCAVQPFGFSLWRGQYCDNGNYRFNLTSTLVDVTIPAELSPIWDWPRCDRLSYEHYTYLVMESGDVVWNPYSGILTLKIKSWEDDYLCPQDARTEWANIWWWGNPWGPIYAEGVIELKFAWNITTRQFHFYEGDCELASRGDLLWYYAGRGEFYAGDLYRSR